MEKKPKRKIYPIFLALIVVGVLLGKYYWEVKSSYFTDALTSGMDKKYDVNAKVEATENDVYRFLYTWFGGFDHQINREFMKEHLLKEKLDMYYPNTPIKTLEDFDKWYDNVILNVQFNSHELSNIKINKLEDGWLLNYDVKWSATFYDGTNAVMNIHQEMTLNEVRKSDAPVDFVIKKLVVKVIE